MVTEAADGWGECAALIAPTYSEEYAEGAWSVLRDHLLPLVIEASRVNGAVLPRPDEVSEILGLVRGHSMAKASVEMAVLDAGLRSTERSLADLLGVRRDRVEAGAVVGLANSETERSALFQQVEGLVGDGYSRVKVKIAPGADVETLGGLRSAFPLLGIQADANGAYHLEEPSHLASLRGLDSLELLCLEQPLDPDDLAGHAELASLLTTPVCLDESVWSLGRLREAISAKVGDMVCIKPARLGGILQAVEAHRICAEASIPVWCGGMLETALARSANAALVALPGFVLLGDLAGGERFAEPDPFLAGADPEGPREAQPIAVVHSGPGVGPEPELQAVYEMTTRRHWAGV
jgi:o-succinylbenzoate synthase